MSEVSEIAKQLELIIKAQVSKKTDSLHTYKHKFENLKLTIEDIHKEATILYEDMKANGFTANTLEAEGYLRCATTILNYLKDILED